MFCVCVYVFVCITKMFAVKSPHSSCTQSSSSTCNGYVEQLNCMSTHNNSNFDGSLALDDSNNYDMRLTSVEHQYEAIRDDGPPFNGISNGLIGADIHSDYYKSNQINQRKGRC